MYEVLKEKKLNNTLSSYWVYGKKPGAECKCAIIELPASRRSICVDGDWFFISVPSCIFRINYILYQGLYYYSTTYGFFKIEDKLFHIPFYNVFKNGYICVEDDFGNWREEIADVDSLIDKFLKHFWLNNSVYRYDETVVWRQYLENGSILSNFENWRDKTKKEKDWIPSADDLIATKISLNDFMEKEDLEITRGFA